MRQRLKLLTAIREKGLRQKDFAIAVGEHETTVSMVVTGKLNLDDVRKVKYARTLGKSVTDLFED